MSQTEFKDKEVRENRYGEIRGAELEVESGRVPTFVLFHKGKVLNRIEGLPTEQQMRSTAVLLQQV